MFNEEDYLTISGIHHFAFCRRRWALIYLEGKWEDNYFTVDGSILHENAHDPNYREKRRNTIITRAMRVSSSRLGISGECDVVEFNRSEKGVNLYGVDGKYTVTPIEYKRGKPSERYDYKCQLMAQALCLEDMLCCDIPLGYLYYEEVKHREKVIFDAELREKTENIIKEMHELYKREYTPKVKRKNSCKSCSLKNICLPKLLNSTKASDYVKKTLGLEVK